MAKICGDEPLCYLDIDIDNTRDAYARAVGFVQTKNLAYGLSSNNINNLGGSELARIPELYNDDYEWSQKGRIILAMPPERIVVKLYRKKAPLAVENFVALCTGEKGKSSKSGKPLHYKGCPFHRILKGFVAQTGDIATGTGAGGMSIYGKKFKDDRAGLKEKFDKRGLLAMCNTGKNSNSSQFFFNFSPTPKLNSKHVIFGEIIEGHEVLDRIEASGTDIKGDGKPTVDVRIVDCGLL